METGYVVDGVSAQDPLAGTGFGLDLGSNSFSNIEVITGGVGAEYGDVTSGVVSVQTQNRVIAMRVISLTNEII